MFNGFRLPMSLARSPLGTLADRSARGRRLNIRDIVGVRFSALPMPPWEATIENGGGFGYLAIQRSKTTPTDGRIGNIVSIETYAAPFDPE
jgi:hypothetical protein